MASAATENLRRRRAPRGSGDRLRAEILDAATELLLNTGHAKAVSIRLVAERVGVTPPSIYLHFQDKDSLLDAVCARYFDKLDDEMQRVSAAHSSNVERLRAQGLTYIRFATRNPELYRIATMGEWRSDSDVDVLVEFTPGAEGTIFDYVRFKEYVASLFDEPVDVIDRAGLKPHLRGPATRDAKYAL